MTTEVSAGVCVYGNLLLAPGYISQKIFADTVPATRAKTILPQLAIRLNRDIYPYHIGRTQGCDRSLLGLTRAGRGIPERQRTTGTGNAGSNS
ncbi:MAG: hypothetical protein KDE53_29810 [Caldilineaceae bacterium]|nr:hypothetical protein [Caldilineaceae bacterium]MCB0122181.1 hypothetical protein [Caldilineaceae bacterium]MCB0186043.1 hypothetical protein [Caldilineaceae bacterium]